ncbi:MAG: biopolymer transporter ExbD [Victivallales bacterium]|nr:biopolymer transporter ExbD [Victivallales bacterium]
MMNWEKHVDTMKPPSSVIILINIFFILLVLFMMSSNFVFLPGIETGASLPELESAQIIQANKLIVTLSTNKNYKKGAFGAEGEKYLYSFNGQTATNRGSLENSILLALANSMQATKNRNAGREFTKPMIVLNADKDIPLQELVNFYAFARKNNANVFLVTDYQRPDDNNRLERPLEK